MQEQIDSQAPADSGPPIETSPSSSDNPISVREAAAALSQYRWKRDAREDRAAEAPAEPAPVENKTADQPEEVPAEKPTEAAEPEADEAPPIEPPRSWSKEWKEEFQTYPREVQEKIALREQERETALRRGQNETAEQRKAVEAKQAELEQLRQHYEQNLIPAVAQMLHDQGGEFADIKTMADVQKMANDDWARYLRWDAHQKTVAAVQEQVKANQQRQQEEFNSRWEKYIQEQNDRFMDAHPELAKPEVAEKARSSARSHLLKLGFTAKDLEDAASGRSGIALYDERIQRLIYNSMRFDEAKSTVAKAKAPAPAAKVQKPGTPTERASERDAQLKSLNNRLDNTGNWKDGAELLTAIRNARR